MWNPINDLWRRLGRHAQKPEDLGRELELFDESQGELDLYLFDRDYRWRSSGATSRQ